MYQDVIDNFDLVEQQVIAPELRNANPAIYWVVQLILRKKDFEDTTKEASFNPFKRGGHEYFMRQWFVSGVEDLESHRESMITWVDLTGGRLYFNLDAKDMRKTLANQVVNNAGMLANFNQQDIRAFVNNFYSVPRLADNSVSQARYVMLDVDYTDGRTQEERASLLDELQTTITTHGLPRSWITVNTVNGTHIFTKIRGGKYGNVNTYELSKLLDEFNQAHQDIHAEAKYNSNTILYFKKHH